MNPAKFDMFRKIILEGAALEIVCLSIDSSHAHHGEWRMNAVSSEGEIFTLYQKHHLKEATASNPHTIVNRALRLGFSEITLPLKAGGTTRTESPSKYIARKR